MIKQEYCGKCSRPLMCSYAGKKGAYDNNGNLKPNKGRFSSEQVKKLNHEEYKKYCDQKRQIAIDFHNKLNKNSKLRKLHYEKVFKNSYIGYISKGQREVYDLLKDDGFLLETVCEGIKCDIVNVKLKVVIEYYGDVFHANPRKYKPTDYISLIKMTAEEKWIKDRKRNFVLRNLGYTVIIIWESEWLNNRNKIFDKLKLYKKSNWVFPKWEQPITKRKWMNNGKINKTISNEDIKKYISMNWKFGRLVKA